MMSRLGGKQMVVKKVSEFVRGEKGKFPNASPPVSGFSARYDKALPDHTHSNCANCLEYALRWREKTINSY